MNSESMSPSEIKDFICVLDEDIRVSEKGGQKEVTIALSEMEVIILDESMDPLETIEYDNSEEIEAKTRESLDWIYSNL